MKGRKKGRKCKHNQRCYLDAGATEQQLSTRARGGAHVGNASTQHACLQRALPAALLVLPPGEFSGWRECRRQLAATQPEHISVPACVQPAAAHSCASLGADARVAAFGARTDTFHPVATPLSVSAVKSLVEHLPVHSQRRVRRPQPPFKRHAAASPRDPYRSVSHRAIDEVTYELVACRRGYADGKTTACRQRAVY